MLRPACLKTLSYFIPHPQSPPRLLLSSGSFCLLLLLFPLVHLGGVILWHIDHSRLHVSLCGGHMRKKIKKRKAISPVTIQALSLLLECKLLMEEPPAPAEVQSLFNPPWWSTVPTSAAMLCKRSTLSGSGSKLSLAWMLGEGVQTSAQMLCRAQEECNNLLGPCFSKGMILDWNRLDRYPLIICCSEKPKQMSIKFQGSTDSWSKPTVAMAHLPLHGQINPGLKWACQLLRHSFSKPVQYKAKKDRLHMSVYPLGLLGEVT